MQSKQHETSTHQGRAPAPAFGHPRTMGRKRSRLGLATVASAIAMSVSVVGAFQPLLPYANTAPTATSTSTASSCTIGTGKTSWLPWDPAPLRRTALNVLADPGVLLEKEMELMPPPPTTKPLGSVKVKRKVPPKIVLKSALESTKQTRLESSSSTDTTIAPSPLPDITRRKRSKRHISTMPGFGSETVKQRAFREGMRMTESRTGKKLVDTLEQKKTRRQINGQAMYENSASVPDSLVQFANEIHTVDRITPKQEVELGIKTQEAIRLQNLHDDLVAQLNRPPTDEEWCAAAGKINLEAIRQAIEDGLEAKNMLVTANLRMVQGVVNLYIRNGLGGQYNAGDLMQEGIMALMRAAEKFDPGRGFRFSTYAMYWIRSAVKRSQIVQSRVITVPQRLYENHKLILRTEKEMRVTLGRKPTMKEVGAAIGMSAVQVERCLTAVSQKCFSLDNGIQNTKKPMGSDRSTDSLIDIVRNREDEDYNKLKHMFLREDLIETLKRHLKPKEVEILLLRYGLQDDMPPGYCVGPLTIAEVSEIVGLKPDKVRRVIIRSLKHLQCVIQDEWYDFERLFP